MLLNHLDLHVPDVQRTAAVLVTYFGFRQEFSRTGLVILRDEANFELVVSEPVAGFGTADQMRLGVSTYHIGFILNSTEAVDQMYASLQLADVELGRPPKAIRGGWLFYCTIPGRIQVEVGFRRQ
ncbi:VOC family protein [Rhizobium sp. R693]|uniref:VOC family protein n=1 Tax=Rhizobium sp. R693 TaxID=1764276 RepID=UPI000B537E80|nr:VOC family protein [Rhizobium sp. R693]OWV83209.1 lactoylglutathione lyase [Rhizobium sp. R693]